MLDFSSSTTHHADPHGRNPVHDDTTGYGGKDDGDEDTLDSFDSHHNDNKEEGVDHGYPEDSDGSGVGSDGSDGGGVEGEESDINYQESHRDGSGSGVVGDEHRRGREHVRLRELSLGGDGTDKRVEGEGEGIGYGDERYDDDDDNDDDDGGGGLNTVGEEDVLPDTSTTATAGREGHRDGSGGDGSGGDGSGRGMTVEEEEVNMMMEAQ